MPAKKPTVRKNPTPKVSAQHPTKARPSLRTATSKRQPGQDETTRGTVAQTAASKHSHLNAASAAVSELPQDAENASTTVEGQENASELPQSIDHDTAETGEPPTGQNEDKTYGEPASPRGPFTAPEDRIDSSISFTPVEETKSPIESKQARVLALLRSPGGATIAAMAATTGWQVHSVRGFLTSVVRQKLGLNLTSEKVDGERRYRIACADPSDKPSGGEPFSSGSQPTPGLLTASPAKMAE